MNNQRDFSHSPADPAAHPDAVVVAGNARFTILTPALIRLEWSPSAGFEDRASLTFINRCLPVPAFQVARGNDRLTIRTDELTLEYLGHHHPFTADNLAIELHLNGRTVRWRPGLEDRANLGGTVRTLDEVSGACPLEPGLLSRDGWVVVDDSTRPLLDDTDPPWAIARDKPDNIDWYFFGYGHDYVRALKDITRVAGPVPMPPRYVFGMWWSRYWPYSDAELRDLVHQFRDHGVPLDVLAIDMDWHLDGWTGYTWNPKYFPDPDGFLAWLHRQGLHTTLNLHPADGVGSHEQRFVQMARATGHDPAETDRIPFDGTDRRFMEAYFRVLHHPLQRQGVDFWWIDWQQDETTEISGLDPLAWLNHLHFHDSRNRPARRQCGKVPPPRPLIMSRWGGLGGHRTPIGFSGDTHSDWQSLAFQPCFTATAGNVAFGYWSHDIGGHFPGPVEPELYVRWLQCGALSPVLRTHATRHEDAERRIWALPRGMFHAARDAIRLRYQLLPYIYSAARQFYDSAIPLCRPLYYEWPEHDEAYRFLGEYLFGDDLLAAPITAPMDPKTGCAETLVWIPPGQWVNWFSNETYSGPAEVILRVPLNEIPLFARRGTIIPMMSHARRTSDTPIDPLVLTIFPGSTGYTQLYEDDGETTGYQEAMCAWTSVSHRCDAGTWSISIGPTNGTFPGMLCARRYELRIRGAEEPRDVRVNDVILARAAADGDSRWVYDTKIRSLTLRLPPHAVDSQTLVSVRS